jgi:hypothetical protein
MIKISASLLLLLAWAFPALAQTQVGPQSWSQSILKAPSAMPQSGDAVGFVHNGLTYKCVFGSAGCFSGGGGGTNYLLINTGSALLINTGSHLLIR